MRPAARHALEQRVLNGEPYASVAIGTPFSPSAARRHMTECVRAHQLRQMRSEMAATLHVKSFALRLAELADVARAVQESTDDPRIKLGAVREQRDTLLALMTRLGVNDTEVLAAISEAQALAVVLSEVLVDEPIIAARLADGLSGRGEADMAEAFRKLAVSASARHVAQFAGRPSLAEVGA